MLTRTQRVQLIAFVVIAMVSVVYAGASYAGLDRLFGARGYVVTARLTDSGGIFPGAEVTYRGVAVGRVRGLELTDDGVDVALDIDSGAPPIPADTEAVVANRSAVGEQYVDLRPADGEGPYLTEGSVIGRDRTDIPLAPDTVLANLDRLVTSVDPGSLRIVVDESYDAFAGAGPDLQRLLDTAGSFTAAATEHLPQTKALLADGRVVLDTQRRQADNIVALAEGLRTIAEGLRNADPDLRRVLDEAPVVSRQVSEVLATSGTDLGVVLANLLTTAQITTLRVDAIEQLLVAYPVISAFTKSVTSNGEGHLGFVFNLFDPHSCTKGYEGTRQRPASDTTDAPVNMNAYCAEPPGSETGVRGAQNAPYPGLPAAPPDPPRPSPHGGPRRDALPGVLGMATGAAPVDVPGLLGLSHQSGQGDGG
ncbi:phospholipid/cholesterol/gamma-HCH transport system substrate-binding protein [Amycolatopsis arida]|uniref:Phospholipid/cholesterol/gamma-HCH transport system substrate-binding protein n=1 Tax=Amycolatopsis arida TaxID=587909 RepID=A0A1I5XKM0_9PSEU|nr:MCE family protein [Amycolatopsis arida]TDX97385.1 phospholipid/cholesterol/gamma-HCH transport system substrate-binding protein [Amycolatopsis arida]SFQ32531.1 phospholipid/cholesterol/gamma-HCH transport system substrate-binding protein [Amycolatopsis arida]